MLIILTTVTSLPKSSKHGANINHNGYVEWIGPTNRIYLRKIAKVYITSKLRHVSLKGHFQGVTPTVEGSVCN